MTARTSLGSVLNPEFIRLQNGLLGATEKIYTQTDICFAEQNISSLEIFGDGTSDRNNSVDNDDIFDIHLEENSLDGEYIFPRKCDDTFYDMD